MYNYGLRSCVIILRKIKPSAVLSSSFNTCIQFSLCSNFQTILKTRFIKRDFYKNINNYNATKFKSKKEQDEIANEKLQKLLKDDNLAKVYKLLKYELEYHQQLNDPIPKNIRPKDWIQLITAPTKSQQRKYLRFLFVNEMKDKNGKMRKQELKVKAAKEWEDKQKTFPGGLKYGLGNNSLFMRLYDKSMDNFYNYSLILSMLFEPKIVFDCGFDDIMTRIELNNCAKQLLYSFVFNRSHINPVHLYLCNAPKNGELMRQLHRLIPSLYDDNFPLDVTPKSYTDIFDKEKLVYLTPDCRTPMTSYDPDNIYIIGAIVDKATSKPYTLAKAKREGIRMEKFPLETYLSWGTGSRKNLTLNQVLSVLLDMNYTKDWLTTLQKHIPSRKWQNEY